MTAQHCPLPDTSETHGKLNKMWQLHSKLYTFAELVIPCYKCCETSSAAVSAMPDDDNTSYSEFVFEIPTDRILQVFPPNMLGQQRHWTLTLNLGTKRLNSWCQLLSVDAGEMMRNGPQMLSLCRTQNTRACERSATGRPRGTFRATSCH